MNLNIDKLREKGWTEKEIKHAQRIIDRDHHLIHPHQHILEEITFWALLFLAAGTTIGVAYLLIPLFIITKDNFIIFFVLAILGISFGTFINHALKDLEHLQTHHHIIMSSVFPLTTIASFLSILGRTTSYLSLNHNLFFCSIVYAISFLLPYLIYHIKRG